jgi:hypothetical protein
VEGNDRSIFRPHMSRLLFQVVTLHRGPPPKGTSLPYRLYPCYMSSQLNYLNFIALAIPGDIYQPQSSSLRSILNCLLRSKYFLHKSSIFCDKTPCSPLKFCLLPTTSWFLAWLILRPCRWRRYVPPKRLLTFNGPHGVISQKTEFFITEDLKS